MKTKKVLYNIISELIFEVVALICGLILPKLIIEAYGSAYNGVIQTIIQFLGYVSILTLGINGPTRVAVYKALAHKDDHKLHSILKANTLFMRKVGGALIINMMLLMVLYPYLVRDMFGWWDVASLVLIIGVGELMTIVFGCSSRLLLKADQKGYINTILMTVSKIASTIFAVYLVKRGSGIHSVRLAMVVCFAVAPVLIDVITKRMYRINSKVKPDYSAIEQRGDAIAHSLVDLVNEDAPAFMLAILTNPIAISIYSVYNLILNNMLKVQEAFTSNLEGAFGEFWAKGETEKFREKFNALEYLMLVYLLLVYTTTAVLILPFMKIYTAGITDANYIQPLFAALFVCATAAYSLRTPYIIAIQAAGKYRDTKKMVTVEAFITVSVSMVGIFICGLNGVVLGILAANIYRIISYSYFCYRKMLDIPIFEFVRRIIWMVSSGAVIIAVQIALINRVWIVNNWMQWVVAGVFCVSVAGTLVLISSWCFYRECLMNAVHLVKTMLSRK